MMNNIYVIGGGTAGWLTALFVKVLFKQKNVTLIESKQVPTIGVGEGTTPNFPAFLRRVGISKEEFQQNMNGTKKRGIHFTNWAGDNTSYLHEFGDLKYAYHFDSTRISNFFKQIGLKRDISYIQDDVVNIKTLNGNIAEIELQQNGIFKTDFVFDCTGFHRLFLGKELKSEWIDTTKILPTNSAIPFRLKNKEKLTSTTLTTTEAITMNHGWMWKVPLQETTGYGYCFDSNYASDDDIKTEIKEYIGNDIEFKNTIKFKSGYYNDAWKGNCIGIGLSSGFFEPLEATSIMTIVTQLNHLVGTGLDESSRESYNKKIRNVNEEILNFIRYHYTCERSDTKFWKDFQKRDMPEKLKRLIKDDGRIKPLKRNEFTKIISNDVFDYWQYCLVSFGNFINKKELI